MRTDERLHADADALHREVLTAWVCQTEQLFLLRDAAGSEPLERATLLAEMATRIGKLAPHWPDGELRRRLEVLAAEVAVPTTDMVEAEHRWEHAIRPSNPCPDRPGTRASGNADS